MTVKVTATVVVDNANTINWSFITNIPATLVTSVATVGNPATQKLRHTTSLSGHILTLVHS